MKRQLIYASLTSLEKRMSLMLNGNSDFRWQGRILSCEAIVKLVVYEPMISSLGLEVPIGSLDKELKKLWEGESAGTRASLTNFAIYSEDPGALERNADLLQGVTKEHACRAILVQNLPGSGKPTLRTWIEAVCQMRGGKKAICSEQIAFLMENGDAGVVCNTVLAYLDSDLPLVFWWQGDLSERFEDCLYSVIDRLIVDSSTWQKPVEQFSKLLLANKQSNSRFKINDLSWTRSYHLRKALSKVFEDALARPHLQEITEIQVSYSNGQHTSALMLMAWIASCLRAASISEANRQDGFTFELPEGRRFLIKCEEEVGCSICSMTIKTERALFNLCHKAESSFIRTLTNLPERTTEQVLPADRESEVDLVLEQLQRAGNNKMYFQTVVPVLLNLLDGSGVSAS